MLQSNRTSRGERESAEEGDRPDSVSEALERRRTWTERRMRRVDPEALARAQEEQVTNDEMIRAALALRGTPYRWGGASRGGFDCSGFSLYLYKRYRGVSLPHNSREQARCGVPVSRDQLRPGDLLFFRTGGGRRINHVGVYIGNNRFVHASGHGRDVRIDSLDGHYGRVLVSARRIPYRPTPASMASRSRGRRAEPASR